MIANLRFSALAVCLRVTYAVLVVAFCSADANAQVFWTGAADPSPPNGVYNNPGNWSGTFGLVPGGGDFAIFNANATYTTTFTANQGLFHAAVRGGQVSWLSESATVRQFTLNILSAGGPNQTLTIGSLTKPMLVTSFNPIEAGTLITIGSGSIAVDGANSALNGPSIILGSFSGFDGTVRYQNGAQGFIGGAIELGNAVSDGSDGLLEILSGADLTSGNINLATTTSTATGTFNVSGAGSTLLQSGASTLTVGSATGGVGTINVNTGGTFTSGSGLITVNATGTINRTGTGVFNVTGNLLLDGGKFLTPGGSFSRGAGQTLTVQSTGLFDGNGVTGTNANVITIGGPGGAGGSLTIGGGNVTLGDQSSLSLAGGSGGSAVFVSHSGGGSGGAGGTLQVNSGSLLMTGNSTITLNGGNGGSSFFEPGGGGGAGGTLQVSGGSFTMNGGHVSLSGGSGGGGSPGGGPGAAGQINVTGGTFTMNGGVVTTGSFTHSGAGVFNFSGGVLHATTFNGNLVNNGGTLAPGTSPGTTTVNGNYTQTAGVLEIELGGTTAGQFDLLNVTGNAILGGLLDLDFISSFTPGLGQSWEIIDIGGTSSGTFTGLTEGAPLANYSGTVVSITYAGGDGNDVALTTATGLAGDFDFDGDVDGRDFLTWQRNTDVGDLASWQASYGAGPLTAASVAVPEPGSLKLLCASVGLLFARRVATAINCQKMGN